MASSVTDFDIAEHTSCSTQTSIDRTGSGQAKPSATERTAGVSPWRDTAVVFAVGVLALAPPAMSSRGLWGKATYEWQADMQRARPPMLVSGSQSSPFSSITTEATDNSSYRETKTEERSAPEEEIDLYLSVAPKAERRLKLKIRREGRVVLPMILEDV